MSSLAMMVKVGLGWAELLVLTALGVGMLAVLCVVIFIVVKLGQKST